MRRYSVIPSVLPSLRILFFVSFSSLIPTFDRTLSIYSYSGSEFQHNLTTSTPTICPFFIRFHSYYPNTFDNSGHCIWSFHTVRVLSPTATSCPPVSFFINPLLAVMPSSGQRLPPFREACTPQQVLLSSTDHHTKVDSTTLAFDEDVRRDPSFLYSRYPWGFSR